MAFEGPPDGDIRATLALSPDEAATGTIRTITLPGGRQIQVPIPAGIRSGQELRVEGQGVPSSYTQRPGDLILAIAVALPGEVASQAQAYPQMGTDMPTYMTPPPTSGAPPPGALYPPYQPGGAPNANSGNQPSGAPIYVYPQPGPPAYTQYPQAPAQPGYGQPPQAISQQHARPKNTFIVLSILALVIIIGSALLVYAAVIRPGQLNAQATSTAQTQAQQTAQVNASNTAQTNATRQAIANTTATAQSVSNANATGTVTTLQSIYTTATSGTPALNDPLRGPDSNNWQLSNSGSGGDCTFTGGTFHVIQTKLPYFFYCTAQARTFSNFAFQVQMTITRGDTGGVVFRADGAKVKFYYLSISQDGIYRLYLYVDRTSTHAQTLLTGAITAIHTGLNQANLVTVIARNSSLYFYINKQYVNSISDSTYTSGQIGFAAEARTQSTEVAFSQAQVWTL
ncbi:MAG: hypothetical protein M3Z08_10100 [Chloroflexota bacterium]|nr:hypothetical protein [Chloroflexota bacterium]